MNTNFESAIKAVNNSASVIYEKLSNFNNFGTVMPPEKITNWSSTEDSCRFTVENVGEMGLRIVDREPNATVKYAADGSSRFNFYLWVQVKEAAAYDSRIKVTLKAELNPVMKMMASTPLQKFVDMLAEALSKHQY